MDTASFSGRIKYVSQENSQINSDRRRVSVSYKLNQESETRVLSEQMM